MPHSARQQLEVRAEDGLQIPVSVWAPPHQPTAIILLFHGLGEYAARYDRFARVCASRGFAVVAHDHRGHGDSCSQVELGHFADEHGWYKVISDCLAVRERAVELFPGTPVALLGHSMGSYIAQSFVIQHPDSVDALVLSASSFSSRVQLFAGRLLARIECWRLGRRGRSKLLDRMSFGEFNRRFAPNRTEFDWLSRDEAEVDKYVTDPLCGSPSSCGLWLDLTSAVDGISTLDALRRVPESLAVCIFGGEADPVGGQRGLTRLARAYRKSGHENVSLKIYAGGRHEMLNEVNRDEVTDDILGWITAHT